MWIPLISFVLAFVLVYRMHVTVPAEYSTYMGVALLAALDSVLGGLRSVSEHRFNSSIFVSGFFTNTLLAAALAYLGDQFGIPIYMAAVFAFGVRIFQNLASLRRYILASFTNSKLPAAGNGFNEAGEESTAAARQ